MKHLLYLMRHAHIDTQNCMIGRTDLALSSLGKAQALFWHDEFKDIYFENIYTSPLARTIQTAEIISNNKGVILESFCEISLGGWEGLSKEEIKQKYSNEWAKRGENFYFYAPPQGESFEDVEKRVLPEFYNLCKKLQNINSKNELEIAGKCKKNEDLPLGTSYNYSHNGNSLLSNNGNLNKTKISLIVLHQAINRIILADILSISKDKIIEIPQSYACLNILDISDDVKFLERKDCPIY